MWNTSSSATPTGGAQNRLTSNVNIDNMCNLFVQNIGKKN